MCLSCVRTEVLNVMGGFRRLCLLLLFFAVCVWFFMFCVRVRIYLFFSCSIYGTSGIGILVFSSLCVLCMSYHNGSSLPGFATLTRFLMQAFLCLNSYAITLSFFFSSVSLFSIIPPLIRSVKAKQKKKILFPLSLPSLTRKWIPIVTWAGRRRVPCPGKRAGDCNQSPRVPLPGCPRSH